MSDHPSRDILLIAAHPDLGRSLVTRTLLAAVSASEAADRVDIRDLYRLYPDFDIDVPAEQRALLAARLVVMLHPIHWYSMPALKKLWLDEVLQWGWAYGPGGTALQGKDLWLVVSTGSGAEAYAPSGHHRHPIGDFLLPYQQSAHTCGMNWLSPQVLHAAHRLSAAEVDAHAALFTRRLAGYPAWCVGLLDPACQDEEAVGAEDRPAVTAMSAGRS